MEINRDDLEFAIGILEQLAETWTVELAYYERIKNANDFYSDIQQHRHQVTKEYHDQIHGVLNRLKNGLNPLM